MPCWRTGRWHKCANTPNRVAEQSACALNQWKPRLVEIIVEPMERENDVAEVKQMFERARPPPHPDKE